MVIGSSDKLLLVLTLIPTIKLNISHFGHYKFIDTPGAFLSVLTM